MTTFATRTVDVGRLADSASMTPRRWGVIAVCFVIALLDGFDTQSIAFIGTSIKNDFGLSTAQMTWVITASTIGMCLGAMSLGALSDRFGRRPTILLALVVFGGFSILGSMAQTPEQIIALRFLIGIGMGGATPALLALTAEYSSRERRGTFMTLVLLGLPGGALLGGLVAAAWLPIVGWRGIFLIGGLLPIVLAVVCYLVVPESPALLAAKGTADGQRRIRVLAERYFGARFDDTTTFVMSEVKTSRGPVRELFSERFRAVTTAVFSIYFLNWIAWFLLLLWMPTALNMLGLSPATAAMGTVTVNGAFILFALPLSLLLPRVNARDLLLVMFGCGIAVAVGLAMAGSSFAIVFVLIGLAGFGIGGQQLALNYLIANAYPTQLRATATGWGIGIGRMGTIVGSALGGVLLSALGVSGYFLFLALPLVLAALATLFVKKNYGSPVAETV
ncbi:MFS transporter [Mycobacterium sp. SMC-4]|uniref:MFS transporter n=1 Tax=Mycobacterium sp. SMC-4 TaxID=2857059 RepID=UPI003D07A16E